MGWSESLSSVVQHTLVLQTPVDAERGATAGAEEESPELLSVVSLMEEEVLDESEEVQGSVSATVVGVATRKVGIGGEKVLAVLHIRELGFVDIALFERLFGTGPEELRDETEEESAFPPEATLDVLASSPWPCLVML